MYVLSEALQSRIRVAIDRVKAALPALEFDETIAIPDFGANVILRFDYVGAEPLDLKSLDALEARLRELVGGDFMANLMGDAARQCGVDFSRLSEILCRIDEASSAEVPVCGTHRAGMETDCAAIRHLFDLPDRYPLWEIQLNPEGLLALALHPADEQPPFADRESTIDSSPIRVHFLPDDGSFRGLMKAAALADERGVSITHVLLDFC